MTPKHRHFYRYIDGVVNGLGFSAIETQTDGAGFVARDPAGRKGSMECLQLEPGMDVVMMDVAAGTIVDDQSVSIDLGDRLLLRFFLRGTIDYRYNDQDLPTTHDNTFLLAHSPDGSTVGHRVAGSHLQHICVYIDRKALNDFLQTDRTELQGLLGQFSRGEAEGLAFDGGTMPLALHEVVQQMWRCTFEGHTRRLYLKAKVLEVLCTLIHVAEARTEPKAIRLSEGDIDKLENARVRLEANLKNPPTLRALAQEVGLNRNKLSQGFQQLFGATVAGYGREIRLSTAKELLKKGRLDVASVADLVGYSDSSSFIAAFKARFGVSPSKAR